MANLVIFVPEFVQIDDIDTCFQDKKAKFEHINSAVFDATAQQKLHEWFLFLEKDYFLAYFRNGKPLKCHYQSRNSIMAFISWGYNLNCFNIAFKRINGLYMIKQKPVHYFVCSEGFDYLYNNNVTEDNSIVAYFDSEDKVDFAEFASVVKSKQCCAQSHFIVNVYDKYYTIVLVNVKNTYILTQDTNVKL